MPWIRLTIFQLFLVNFFHFLYLFMFSLLFPVTAELEYLLDYRSFVILVTARMHRLYCSRENKMIYLSQSVEAGPT